MKIRNIPFGYEIVGGRYVVNHREAEIMRHIKQTKLLTDYSFLVADINGDSVVDTSDNTLMMRDILAPSVCEHNYEWVEAPSLHARKKAL